MKENNDLISSLEPTVGQRMSQNIEICFDKNNLNPDKFA